VTSPSSWFANKNTVFTQSTRSRKVQLRVELKSSMSDDEITRREALGLARLGVLLGTGLCVAANVEAQKEIRPPGIKPGIQPLGIRPDYMTVKLYAHRGKEASLVKSVIIPKEATVKLEAVPNAAMTVKLWAPPKSPGGEGNTIWTWSGRIEKQ